jgi:hypothetical protein
MTGLGLLAAIVGELLLPRGSTNTRHTATSRSSSTAPGHKLIGFCSLFLFEALSSAGKSLITENAFHF